MRVTADEKLQPGGTEPRMDLPPGTSLPDPAGDAAAREVHFNELTAESYEQLRRVAASYLRRERPDHTLQATALVHEAFLRLIRLKGIAWQNSEHVMAFAANAMRQILVTYAVARKRLKRGGPNQVRLPLDEALDQFEERALDLAQIDAALQELHSLDQRQAQVVEMRFFGGLTEEEIAAELGLSRATVKREWAVAKLWLRHQLAQARQ